MTIGSIGSKIINSVARVIKRNPRTWVFGAWSGNNYSDNPKYIFEYVNNNCDDINAIWITKSKSVRDKVNSLGYKAYLYRSLKGMYYCITAGAAFETAGNEDISPLINNELTKTIMTWHGVGGKSSKWKGKPFGKTFTKFKDDYLPASSELYVDIMTVAKNVPRERFEITGQARDDAFILRPRCSYIEDIKLKYLNSKLLIYMPTHRNFGNHGNEYINPDEFEQLNTFLKTNNYVLVYKPHYHELQFFLDLGVSYSHIIFAKEEYWTDPYEYLHYFDLMISDYSSCMYDYLCTGKPIILFTYDIEEFETDDAGLHESFWELPIGPMCKTWDEVCCSITALFAKDEWTEQREKCCNAFHRYNDGRNCERITNWVRQLVKE